MNTGIDVVATIKPTGEIKPLYIRLEDDNHSLQTCKIENITAKRTEQYSGINTFFYACLILVNNKEVEIKLRFYIDSHKWVLVK